jgi:hypothetical protein
VRLIQGQQLTVLLEQTRLAPPGRQGAGFLRRRHCVVEPPGLRAGRRQGADKNRLLVRGQFAGAFGQLHGFRTVPELRFRVGGENPSQVVERQQ